MAGHFNHRSTADEVLDGIDLTGKRALVTGGASGIGVETVRALASKGAEVVIAARNVEQAEAAKTSIAASTGNHSIRIVTLDLASLATVESAANECLQRFVRLDFLINNAGVMACPFAQTEEGLELQFGSNHIGHFYFTKCLMPLLLTGAPSRVVSLTSMAHRMSPVVFDDIQYATRAYDKWQAYSQSKTANALFAVALNARFSGRGVEAFSVHPVLSRHHWGDIWRRKRLNSSSRTMRRLQQTRKTRSRAVLKLSRKARQLPFMPRPLPSCQARVVPTLKIAVSLK